MSATKDSATVIFWEVIQTKVVSALKRRAQRELNDAIKAGAGTDEAKQLFSAANKTHHFISRVMGMDVVAFAVWYQRKQRDYAPGFYPDLDPEPTPDAAPTPDPILA